MLRRIGRVMVAAVCALVAAGCAMTDEDYTTGDVDLDRVYFTFPLKFRPLMIETTIARPVLFQPVEDTVIAMDVVSIGDLPNP